MSLSVGPAPATLNYTASEQEVPYADLDLVVQDNTTSTELVHATVTTSGSASLIAGDNITITAASFFVSTGYKPLLNLTIIQDGITIYDQTTPAIIGASLVYNFIVNPGSTYVVNITSTCYTYHYVRTQDFQKNDCISPQIGTIVSYNQEYVSNVSTMDAQSIAFADSSFIISGQANANTNGSCMTPLPSDAVGILVIDVFNDADLCAYINTSGTIPYQIPIYTGTHNFEPNDGTSPSLCYALASDPISGMGSLKRRFEINFARLINENPLSLSLVIVVRGRAASSGTLSGAYSLKGASGGYMIMTGSSGSYIPSTSGAPAISTNSYSGVTIGGSGDGTIGLTTGAIVMTFTYDNDPASSTYKQITLS